MIPANIFLATIFSVIFGITLYIVLVEYIKFAFAKQEEKILKTIYDKLKQEENMDNSIPPTPPPGFLDYQGFGRVVNYKRVLSLPHIKKRIEKWESVY